MKTSFQHTLIISQSVLLNSNFKRYADIVPVTLQELLDYAICQLSKGKACGYNEIDTEHIHVS